LLAACAGGGDGPYPDASANDANNECQLSISFDDDTPDAGTTVRATAVVINGSGVLDYTWSVAFDPSGANTPVATTPAQPDNSEIEFPVANAGPYRVTLDVTAAVACLQYSQVVNAVDPGANSLRWRVRVNPGPGVEAPPQEFAYEIPGGADYTLNPIMLSGGALELGTVRGPGGVGIPAYLRWTIAGPDPGPMIEGFAGATGVFEARVWSQASNLLVVPASSTIAPRVLALWSPGDPIDLDAGVAVSGVVRDRANAPLAGARVSLAVDGVPSTLATTDAAGAYTVRARAGTSIDIVVAPPAGSGLPVLRATTPWQTTIDARWSAGLVIRDAAGLVLRDPGGGAAAGAKVTFVGPVASPGTITGAAVVDGTVAIAATANGAGALPATLVPGVVLSAVIAPSAGVVGIANANFTAGVPANLTTPAMTQLTAHIASPMGDDVAGAQVQAIPIGTLAIAQAIGNSGVSNGAGNVAFPVATGGAYDIVIDDRTRALARRRITAATAFALGNVTLLDGLELSGAIRSPAGAPVPYASIEVYCNETSCSADETLHPAAEAATDLAGNFGVILRDPGIQ
jgi:hypothetical protein